MSPVEPRDTPTPCPDPRTGREAVLDPSSRQDGASAPHGQYQLHHGEALAFLRTLPNASVDAVITDPPYSSGGRRENARSIRKSMVRTVEDAEWIAGDGMSTNGFVWMVRCMALEARRVLRPGGHLLSFIDWRMYPSLSGAIESADLRQHPTLVWDKTQFGMGAVFRNQHEWIGHFTAGTALAPQRRDVANVLRSPPVRDGEHPTQKPVALLRTLVSVVAPKGGVVLDPFMGSGTTGVAALLEGRRFIGSELTEHYYRVAQDRIGTAARGYRDDGAQMVMGLDGEGVA